MNKEELIKLIETLEFEEVRCMTLSYYKKKPRNSCYSCGDEDINPKTITFGTDLERIINQNYEANRNYINDLYKEIQQLKEENEQR